MYINALKVGLLPKDFWSMTFNEHNYYIEGKEEQALRELDNTRLICWSNISPHSKKIRQPKDVFSIPELDNANKSVKPNLTKEEYKYRTRKLKKAFRNG